MLLQEFVTSCLVSIMTKMQLSSGRDQFGLERAKLITLTSQKPRSCVTSMLSGSPLHCQAGHNTQ